MASAYFTNYASILSRVYFAEFIDDNIAARASSRCRPSKVAGRLTGLRYSAAAIPTTFEKQKRSTRSD